MSDQEIKDLEGIHMDDAASDNAASLVDQPRRVQLSRAKGWKMPPNTVKVDRTTKWGNPYKEGITPGNYASWFRADLTKEMATSEPTEDHPWSRHLHAIGQNVRLLRGKNLACWCSLDAPCHADVLLELANRPRTDGETGPGRNPK